ncbi:MAG: hypothetical protein AB8G99_25925 [Planctomycetaceae bacterium]
MKLVPLKCSSCSGALSRVSDDTVLCIYCSTAYLLVKDPKPSESTAETPTELVEEQYTPCDREVAVREQMTQAEYHFWQSLPPRPEVKRNRRGRLQIDLSDHFSVSLAAMAVGVPLSLIGFEVRTVGIFGMCILVPAFLVGWKRMLELWKVKRSIADFSRKQSVLWKEIRNIRGEIELRQRLP